MEIWIEDIDKKDWWSFFIRMCRLFVQKWNNTGVGTIESAMKISVKYVNVNIIS